MISEVTKGLLFILVLAATTCYSQTFSFSRMDYADDYDIRFDSVNAIACLYRTSESDWSTTFRKVFLNERLKPIDSVEYVVPGSARLVGSVTNEKYVVHVFNTAHHEVQSLYFLFTGKKGRFHHSFLLRAADFQPCFHKRLNDWNSITVHLLPNVANPETLILYPIAERSYEPMIGRTIALSAEDGRLLWMLQGPTDHRMLVTPHELVGLRTKYLKGNVQRHRCTFYDKENGSFIAEESLYEGKGYRNIDVFTIVGSRLVVGGKQFDNKPVTVVAQAHELEPVSWQKVRLYHYYVSEFDFSGNRILDVVDTIGRTLMFDNPAPSAFKPHLTAEEINDELTMGGIATVLTAEQLITASERQQVYGSRQIHAPHSSWKWPVLILEELKLPGIRIPDPYTVGINVTPLGLLTITATSTRVFLRMHISSR